MIPHPKPAKRIVDCDARPLYDEQVGPLRSHLWVLTQHHIVPRSQGGDDVPENLVWVEGHGTLGFHGVLESRCADGFTGLTYPEAARALVEFVEARPELLEYVNRKKYPGWLRSHYSVSPYVCPDCGRGNPHRTCDDCNAQCIRVGESPVGREDRERAEGVA